MDTLQNYIGRLHQSSRRYIDDEESLGELGVPKLLNFAVFFILLTITLFILWAAFASLDEKTIASGKIIPQGSTWPVQHLEGGIVEEVFVEEGEIVEAGQALARLADTAPLADLEQMRSRKIALILQAERLRAFAEDRSANFDLENKDFSGLREDQKQILQSQLQGSEGEQAVIAEQIEKRKTELQGLQREHKSIAANLSLLKEERDMRESLFAKQLISKLELIKIKREFTSTEASKERILSNIETMQAEIETLHKRLVESSSRRKETAMKELGSVTSMLVEVEQMLEKLQDRVERLTIRSPVAGIVQQVPVRSQLGVLPPGGLVAEIVPLDKELLLEAKISTLDIGFVREGQDVQVKVHTYNFSRYGIVEGTLESISASTFMDEDGAPYYKGMVRLVNTYVGNNASHSVMPGMTAQADIITGSKTILQYLLKPVYTNLNEAFRER